MGLLGLLSYLGFLDPPELEVRGALRLRLEAISVAVISSRKV